MERELLIAIAARQNLQRRTTTRRRQGAARRRKEIIDAWPRPSLRQHAGASEKPVTPSASAFARLMPPPESRRPVSRRVSGAPHGRWRPPIEQPPSRHRRARLARRIFETQKAPPIEKALNGGHLPRDHVDARVDRALRRAEPRVDICGPAQARAQCPFGAATFGTRRSLNAAAAASSCRRCAAGGAQDAAVAAAAARLGTAPPSASASCARRPQAETTASRSPRAAAEAKSVLARLLVHLCALRVAARRRPAPPRVSRGRRGRASLPLVCSRTRGGLRQALRRDAHSPRVHSASGRRPVRRSRRASSAARNAPPWLAAECRRTALSMATTAKEGERRTADHRTVLRSGAARILRCCCASRRSARCSAARRRRCARRSSRRTSSSRRSRRSRAGRASSSTCAAARASRACCSRWSGRSSPC